MFSKYDYNSFLRYDSALNPFQIFKSVSFIEGWLQL